MGKFPEVEIDGLLDDPIKIYADLDNQAVVITLGPVKLELDSIDKIMSFFYAVIQLGTLVWPENDLVKEWLRRNQTGNLDPVVCNCEDPWIAYRDGEGNAFCTECHHYIPGE